MKKSKFTVGALLLLGCVSLFAASKKDQVLMTVGNKNVTLSEFEYMYHKNNQQQLAEQPLEKYLDMFTVYKLKVADAEAAGIDTTAAFINEFNGYRNDLLKPFLTDTVAEENEAKALYARAVTNVKASHIMLNRGQNLAEENAIKAKLDSIRNCILAGESFEDLAVKYSVDRSVSSNKGSMGWIQPGRFPKEFEDMCYNTPIGQVSPAFKTDFGYHIVKTYEEGPNPGQVLVEHILKLYPQRDSSQEKRDAIKATMDSIYQVVKAGADFEDVARRESEDPGSARKGGKIDWFGRGQMVAEFEKVSYELKDGEISKPFATRYGIHIVKKLDHKGVDTYANMHEQLMAQVKAGDIGYNSQVEKLKSKYKLMRVVDTEKELLTYINENNKIDSVFYAKYENSNKPILIIDGEKYPVSLLIAKAKYPVMITGEEAKSYLNNKIDELATELVVDHERDIIASTNVEYRNLLNEYRDGMLLFEISNQKVWNKGLTDSEGLTKYFEENRAKYKWTEPKFKGFLISVANDSIAKLVKAQINNLSEDTLGRALRKEFGKQVKIDRVLVAKGENKFVDAEVFGGEKVAGEGKYPVYFVAKYRIIPQPEDVNDIKGPVVSDYQNYLEKAWVEELKAKYPVKVDAKVLKKVK